MLFRSWAVTLAALVFVQMLLGAFMAGLDAGLAFNDWPTYGGLWMPPGLYDLSPWWINHFENHSLVHFQHRTVGYAVAALVFWLHVTLLKAGADKPVKSAGYHMLLLTTAQVTLGIVTVTSKVAIPLAALHQVCALLLFASALWLVFVLFHDYRNSFHRK